MSVLIIEPSLNKITTISTSVSTIQLVREVLPSMLAGPVSTLLGRITTHRTLQASTPSLGDMEKMEVAVLLKTRFGSTTSASIQV